MSEERVTEIKDEEIGQDQLDPREELKNEIFVNLKEAFVEEQRLLGRFLEFSREHSNLEFEEHTTQEESDEALRKANKIRDKLLAPIQEKYLYIFDHVETNTLVDMIVFHLDAKDHQYKVVLEVLDEGFNLEVI